VEYQAPKNGFRTFLLVLCTQGISVFGNAMTFFATTIWLTQVLYARPEQRPQLAFALSAVSLAFAVPTIVFAPVAGAWVDRHDRKRTMMLTDFAASALSVAMATLLLTGAMRLWTLIVILALSATIAQFHSAGLDTSYAMLVPNELLPRANGMVQTMFSLTGILAPATAATIIALPALARQGRLPGLLSGGLSRLSSGAPLAIIADAATFLVAAVALLFLYIPSPERADLKVSGKPRKSMWADVKEGGAYIVNRRPLLLLLITFAVANFAMSPTAVFAPLILKFRLAADWSSRGMTFETAMALMGTVTAVGGVAGGFAISTWGGLKKRRVYGILIPLVVSGAAQVVYGLSGMLFLTIAAAALIAAMIPVANSHSQAIWQHQTPRELQGRVFAVRRVIAQFTYPLSTAMAGWASAKLNPGSAMAALGVVAFVVTLTQIFNPALVRVEDKEWLDRMAAIRTGTGQVNRQSEPVAGDHPRSG